jgi:Protein of unknown function (DUF1360)
MSSDGAATKDVPRAMQGYAPPAQRSSLLSYATLMGVFAILVGAIAALARRQGRSLPERVGAGDLVTIGVAAHKLSRVIAKDKVTSPLRAPFTELRGASGPAELSESARGDGLRRAVGELLVCPYCLGLWVVSGFLGGLLFAPRLARFVAAAFSALAISDFLQLAYKAAKEKGVG